jgi:large subunit ribosomal protein L6
MSRIGLKPVPVTSGVTVAVSGSRVTVKGPKGELVLDVPDGIAVQAGPSEARVERSSDSIEHRSLHGTVRSLLANMIRGVSQGYQKDLEIQGVGYRAQIQGRKLVMNIGYSHPVEFEPDSDIQIQVADGVRITVTGIDKQKVGEVGARIRGFKKAEPYKGKGVRYKDEKVRRKAGKTVA